MIVEFNTNKGRKSSPVIKNNNHTVWVEIKNKEGKKIIKRHKIKHIVVVK